MYELYKRIYTEKRKNNYDLDILAFPSALSVAFIVLILFFFVAAPVLAKGSSMNPTINGEFSPGIMFRKGTIFSSSPEIGEIWSIKSRTDDEVFTKRIVAFKGDSLYVQNDRLMRDYQKVPGYPDLNLGIEKEEINTNYYPDKETYLDLGKVIGKPKYFVMGDNYMNSFDSRNFGAVSDEELVGRVFYLEVIGKDIFNFSKEVAKELKYFVECIQSNKQK